MFAIVSIIMLAVGIVFGDSQILIAAGLFAIAGVIEFKDFYKE